MVSVLGVVVVVVGVGVVVVVVEGIVVVEGVVAVVSPRSVVDGFSDGVGGLVLCLRHPVTVRTLRKRTPAVEKRMIEASRLVA
jgi:hypothetical protein